MARFCAACGTQLADETARFCTKCGAAVAPFPEFSSPVSCPSRRETKWRTVALLIAGILTLLIICFIVSRGSKSTTAAAQNIAGITGQPATTSSESTQAETAKPVEAKPQHLQWQLYLLQDKNLHGGMTKQEIDKVLFRDELSTKTFHELTCTTPYNKESVICETSGIVRRGTDQIPVKLEFWMGAHNELTIAKEAFPIQLADDVRSFLSARLGEPTSYAPTSWKLSAGCGHTGQHPPGQCATIALFTGDTTNSVSNESMLDWGTIDWEDFLTNQDLQEAQKQANGST